MNLTKNFASRRQSWRDSRQDRAETLATVNLLLRENLGEIRGSIAARFWPPGLLLPGENLGEIRGRIAPRFWPPGFFLLGENLGENLGKIRGRIPARFWPPGFLLPGENLGEIRGRIPANENIQLCLPLQNFDRDLGEISKSRRPKTRRDLKISAAKNSPRFSPRSQNLVEILAEISTRSKNLSGQKLAENLDKT